MLFHNKLTFRKKLVLLLLFIVGYSPLLAGPVKEKYSVMWSEEYQMPALLSDSISIKDQPDLKKLLIAPWYAAFAVVNTRTLSETNISNCNQYLLEATDKIRTLRENEMSPFLEFVVMCRATKILVDAKKPLKSNVPKFFLNRTMPNKFPKAMAVLISKKESIQSTSNKYLHYWGDINKGLKFESESKNKVSFSGEGGEQEIVLIGRGDFNNDGYEDVLLSSRETVQGGSYFNYRLFSLTASEKGEWELIKEYQY